MKLIILIFLQLPLICFSKDWSDSLDLNSNSKFIFLDTNSMKYGFKEKGDIIIKPKFENGFSFHDKFATVKKKGKWGAINLKGKWVINPKYDLMSTIVNGEYLAQINSTFYWMTVSGEQKFSGDHIEIDYHKLLYFTKISKLEDRELITRVLEMQITRFKICDAEPSDEMIKKKRNTYSRLLIHKYYFTRLFLNGSLNK